MFRGKKYQESAKQIDRAALYDTNEAMELIVKTAPAKFGYTIYRRIFLRFYREPRQAALLFAYSQTTIFI